MEAGEILFLTGKDVAEILTPKRVLEACDEVFKLIGRGEVIESSLLKFSTDQLVSDPREAARFSVRSAYIRPWKVAGQKWLGASETNPNKGLPRFCPLIVLNDGETSMPIAILDGISVTALRTAGHSGVGAKYLARKDSSIVAMIGCGVEGRSHLEVMNELFNIKEVRAYSRTRESRERYIDEMGKKLKVRIVPATTPREAVKGADIVCMVTSSPRPIVMEEWIEQGTYIAAISDFKDLDFRLARRADKWVIGTWQWDLQWIESERWQGLVFPHEIYGSLDEIATDKKRGRETEQERILMTHSGTGALDVGVGYKAYKLATEKGIGKKINMLR